MADLNTSTQPKTEKGKDSLEASLPVVTKSIDPTVFAKALKDHDLAQYTLGTEKTLTVGVNENGSYRAVLKEGSLSTTSNFSPEGKLDIKSSYSMNGGLRTGYQGIEATAAALKKAAFAEPEMAFKNSR